ncbi:MAG: TIGR01777 family protein [Ignavibacteria bacterium]|nr:TIGR01777 family protein [Ignavibacteria bacterium]
MRVVITGATGFIGGRMVTALTARGDSITVLSRHPERALAAVPGAERALLWSPGVHGAWAGAVDGCDAVIHLAGESVGGQRWNAAFKRRLLESRVLGTRDMVRAIAEAKRKPALLLSASGIGYYGDAGEARVDEHSPAGEDVLANICRAWEAEALAAREHGVRVVTPRLGLVLARDGGALPRLALPFSLFAGGPVGSGRQWFPWVHVDDAIAAILHCMDTAALDGAVNVVAPEPVRNREFCAALGKAMGRPSWLRVPGFALRIAVGEFAETLLGGQRASCDALLSSGYAFRHPLLDEALASLYGRS